MASNLTSIGLWLDDDPYGAPAPGETRASSSGGSGGSGLAGHLKAKAPLMLGPLTNFVMNRLPGAKNIEKAPTPRGIAGIPNRAAEIVAGVPGGVFQMVSDSTR
ncbi:MAG TPA: hypothetical protein VD926_15335, partial [Acidimicrobiales bacterium]|nr:hypothetical protein [Acidimicrobiales bacterium]